MLTLCCGYGAPPPGEAGPSPWHVQLGHKGAGTESCCGFGRQDRGGCGRGKTVGTWASERRWVCGGGAECQGCAPHRPECTETRRVVGQPSSSTGPWSGSSREYSTEKVTGFT